MIGSNGLLGDQIGLLCNERGDELTVWGRRKPEKHTCTRFIKTDLLDDTIDIEELKQHDAIFYVAGAGIQSNLRQGWEMVLEMNTMLPIRLINRLSESGFEGSFVTFGSYFEIGANAAEHLFTEDEVAASERPVPNDYCVSKRMLTRFARSFAPTLNHLHLILPTIYGPDECEQRLIPYTLGMIEWGERPQFTAGTQVRQYIYVGDVARMVLALVDAGQSGMFNIPGAECLTVHEVVEQLYQDKGVKIPEGIFGTQQRQDTAMQNLQLDGSRLRDVLGTSRQSLLHEIVPQYNITKRA